MLYRCLLLSKRAGEWCWYMMNNKDFQSRCELLDTDLDTSRYECFTRNETFFFRICRASWYKPLFSQQVQNRLSWVFEILLSLFRTFCKFNSQPHSSNELEIFFSTVISHFTLSNLKTSAIFLLLELVP